MKPGIVLCIGPREERDRICRWLKANGADPRRIPEWARIIVTGGRLTVTEIVFHQRPSGGKWARRSPRDMRALDLRQKTYRIRYDLKDIK